MSSFSRIILLLLLVENFALFSCHDIGTGILSNVQFWRRTNAPSIRRIVDISLHDCAVECGLRSSCSGLNYQRMLKMCELLGRTTMIYEAERNKGWVYAGIDDKLNRDVMEKYCGNRDNCPAGQKCFRGEGNSYQCGIKECTEPESMSDDYIPNKGKVLHVGATVRMTNIVNQQSYYISCCNDSTWAENCHGNVVSSTNPTSSTKSTAIPSSTVSPSSISTAASTSHSTSTSISTSTAASSTTPISITIGEDEWYTLPSDTRMRQLASVSAAGIPWTNAIDVCKKNGGMLARINDEEERILINDWLTISPMEAQYWVGGKHETGSDLWLWETPSRAVKIIDMSLWGSAKPTPDIDRKCTSLYRDGTYYLGNWNCNDGLKFICERDLTDVQIDGDEWFIVNSTQETREIAYIGNPTLSLGKAQEVCEKNDATLAHVYNLEEVDILQPFLAGEPLWVGAKYDGNVGQWYWWSNGSNPDIYVDSTLWAPGEPSNDIGWEQCIQLSRGDQSYLGDNTCEEENSFLCQREIKITIPDDAWFSLGPNDATQREVAYVYSQPLNWRQSQEVCEQNEGTLVHIYSESDIKLIFNGFRADDITAEGQLWTGGKFVTNTNEWVWWSNHDVNSAIDLSALTSGSLDTDTGRCIVLSSTVFSIFNDFCDRQKTFLCQRETAYVIEDSEWFSIDDRDMAFVSHESTWEAAETVCEWNGGTLAYVNDRQEIDKVLGALNKIGVSSQALIWLGGMYLEDQNMWVWQANNMPVDESLWSSGRAGSSNSYPEDVCIQLYEDIAAGMYFVQNGLCAQEHSFFCQRYGSMKTM